MRDNMLQPGEVVADQQEKIEILSVALLAEHRMLVEELRGLYDC